MKYSNKAVTCCIICSKFPWESICYSRLSNLSWMSGQVMICKSFTLYPPITMTTPYLSCQVLPTSAITYRSQWYLSTICYSLFLKAENTLALSQSDGTTLMSRDWVNMSYSTGIAQFFKILGDMVSGPLTLSCIKLLQNYATRIILSWIT